MLSSVDERNRGKQMGYVYFSWLLGLLVGMVIMNLLIKFHPTRFAFLMALVVLIAWVLYYFVNITSAAIAAPCNKIPGNRIR
jgi:multisubunit Na+/H+ antiporter MnhE subunit